MQSQINCWFLGFHEIWMVGVIGQKKCWKYSYIFCFHGMCVLSSSPWGGGRGETGRFCVFWVPCSNSWNTPNHCIFEFSPPQTRTYNTQISRRIFSDVSRRDFVFGGVLRVHRNLTKWRLWCTAQVLLLFSRLFQTFLYTHYVRINIKTISGKNS